MIRRRAGALLLGVLLAAAGLGAAPARADAQSCQRGTGTPSDIPWPQLASPPQQIWPLSTGAGITVAVIATGVDARALDGADLQTGTDFYDLPLGLPGTVDCNGLGTGVAGIIAAPQRRDVGFVGYAPGARILPIRVTDAAEVAADGTGQRATVAGFALAVDWAVAHGAQVIVIPVVTFVQDPRLAAAVAAAVRHDVVVVASAGSSTQSQVPYPAAYPGVLAVGAVNSDGVVTGDSRQGSFVGIAAPGAGVYASHRFAGVGTADGAAYATAFVGATAALVRSRWPDLKAAGVISRIETTAALAPGGVHSPAYGYGVLDPYAAVANIATGTVGRPTAGTRGGRRVGPERARAAAWFEGRRLALLGAGAGVLGVTVVIVAAYALPAGRRQRWQPVLATAPVETAPETVPPTPAPLFDDR